MSAQKDELVRVDLPADLYKRLQQEAAERGIPLDVLMVALPELTFEKKH